jgi:hypothetical protein
MPFNKGKNMSSLNSIEQRLPWSFLGFLLGTISLCIAIVFFYLSKQADLTDLRFIVDDEFPLVELRDRFPDIKVLFNDEDILRSAKEIKILRVQLVNDGQAILQSFYDQTLPFSLSFQKSKIIAVSPVSPTTGYLHDNLFRNNDPNEYEEGYLLFDKPIIEKESRVPFKVYLLQDKGIPSTVVKALGKISGLDEIPVVSFDPDINNAITQRPTDEVIAIGSAAGYVGMIVSLLTFVLIMLYIKRREKRTRKKRCRKFLELNDNITTEQRTVIDSYAEGWCPYCLRTIRILVQREKAIDISELLQNLIPKGVRSLNPFSFIHLRNMLPLCWDPSVFTLSDNTI